MTLPLLTILPSIWALKSRLSTKSATPPMGSPALGAKIDRDGHAQRHGHPRQDSKGKPSSTITSFGSRRSEERRVGNECVSTCSSGWSPYHSKKKTKREYATTTTG